MFSVPRSPRASRELDFKSILRAAGVTLLCYLAAFACQAPPPDSAEEGRDASPSAGQPLREVVPPPANTPRLVLLIVVDQFSSNEFERFEPFFEHGYRQLIDRGVVLSRSVHQHARTDTAPGCADLGNGILTLARTVQLPVSIGEELQVA